MNIYGAVYSESQVDFLRNNKMGIEVYSPPVDLNNLDEYHKTISGYIEGMSGVSMHGTSYDMAYTSNDPLIMEVVNKRFIQSIQAASFHKINYLVFHSAYRPFFGIKGTSLERWYVKASIDFWKGFISNIPDGMTVLLENVEDNDPEVLLEIIEGINSPKIGFCFDAGHAHAYSSVPLSEWVKVLGRKINHVHLSDNDGKNDLHLPLGKGNLPLVSTIHDIFKYADNEIPFILECDIPSSVRWLKETIC
jgi:sugar phosphate isomerase/epimerase